MHTQNRNHEDVWFALKLRDEEVRNENGLLTGEHRVIYSEPDKKRMSISVSSGANNLGSQGMVTLDPYGITTAYTHRLTTHDKRCPINEESLIWIGKEPKDGEHNFKVVRVARSLNHLIYYVKEVDVGEEN